ncbi:MAG: glucose 1-dehydrogenase [Proteobacteria bacterium]|nr:glucose 1-dehydrogenase [Pseudomonadota bacterium]MBI3498094.1 glucose 1-dehydrogenase [Pseudomonadota bacterium]
MSQEGRLQGKIALITGAASGIGRAIARAYASEGAAIVIVDIATKPREGGEPTHELLAREGFQVRFIEADIAEEAASEAAVAATVREFGRLDVLVNDAAISGDKTLTETSLAEWNRVMAVNVTGVFLMCRAAIKQMLTQEPRAEARGRIVNISSQHGMIAAPGNCAYGTSKSAVAYLTRQIATDYAKQGIICNAVAPGKILTGRSGSSVDPQRLAYSHARTPLPRLGKPEDVARAAVFLASDEASFITGVNLMVDGGWMAA